MNIMYFDPFSTSGPDGYINYKMSGGDGGGGGNGCGNWAWVLFVILLLCMIGKLL